MTITFKKKLPSDSDQSAPTEENVPERALSESEKRRLRRLRIDAAKQGMIIPYEPRSRPAVDPDAPKLTKTGKRMARKRKKYATHLAELGLTVDVGGPSYFKVKKRKKDSPAVVLGTDGSTLNEKAIPATDLPEDSLTKTGGKKRKRSKKIKKVEESMPSADNALEKDTGHVPLPEEKETSAKALKKKRKKLKKAKKVQESTPAADNHLEENTGDVVSIPVEEIKVKLENESGSEEQIASVEAMPTDAPEQSIKVEMPAKTKKQRFILFLGNLSYEVTEAEIRAHFLKVGKIVSVRISKHVDKAMQGKCKGFAHLEVADEESYLKALSMHHSQMKGRRINVEYSSGQTRDMRLGQKEKTRATKAAVASGDILDLANPCESKGKKKKKVQRQQRQGNANQVWL